MSQGWMAVNEQAELKPGSTFSAEATGSQFYVIDCEIGTQYTFPKECKPWLRQPSPLLLLSPCADCLVLLRQQRVKCILRGQFSADLAEMAQLWV